ncbi:hypothetical protein PHYSODRAFT_506132 [Phytophthora sojae]|uniref:Centriolar satellite-associated tubulin polyglutamylase complex regulator 1 n=1 Tax=Phytophthora sojae (strain P6497) TaxID=1094619 RepID=G4ZLE1_PHYSP|nr:hypothetical protein PHYSODRAFT_506132 [Phytophthora sojae]EGZ16223.1 hypothetical protein PHYSODRAFT_506132 [Phytophthora sojae]|eukprot:XP_009529972.1 hypothetical protein PHYSODRAFT_506132 [Phytophthora sojae]
MGRVQAERLIASAYRIPASISSEIGKAGDGSAAAAAAASSSLPASKLRTLTRLPSRGLTSLLRSSSEFYLQQSGVQFYVDDLVRQLQDKRPDQPAQFIASYFSAVVKGTNVKGRAFEYINGCLQNRAAFLSQLQRSYARTDQNTLLSVGDFTEMLWCQCRDLPPQLVKQATCHLPEGEDGQRRASLRTLLAAFSACFFYNVLKQNVRYIQRHVVFKGYFNIPPMGEVEQIAVKSSNFKEFCRLFYESPVVSGCIVNLQLAFQKLAPVSK